MRRTTAAVALSVLLLSAGCAALSTGPRASVSVDNDFDAPYRVTAYVVTDPVSAGNVTVRATTDDGNRRTVDLERLETEGPFSDVALAERWNATRTRGTVGPRETTTVRLTGWEPGQAVLYVLENAEGRLVRVEYAECGRSRLRLGFVLSDTAPNGVTNRCRRGLFGRLLGGTDE